MLHQTIFSPATTKPALQIDDMSKLNGVWHVVRLSFNNSTWLALGATLQVCLFLLPIAKSFAIMPGILFILYRIALTCLISFGVLSNPYLKGVIPYKYAALMPDEHGNFPAQDESPSKEKIAVLLLHARVNHPAGWLASPHVMKFGMLFEKMNDELSELPQNESGFLGHCQTFIPTPDGNTESIAISYWRSKEHIMKYGESPTHREALKWWSELGGHEVNGGKIPHIGIGHEIYESLPGHWETMYIGTQPTLFGATSYLRKGTGFEKGAVPDEWISPIVAARRGKLAGIRGRFGMPLAGTQKVKA